MPTDATALPIDIDTPDRVSALLRVPKDPTAALVLAHGAGAGMEHPFLESLSRELALRDVATLRFRFPYMERRSKRPDSPAVAQATVRAAVAAAGHHLAGVPLFAGGKSFGGRMTSQAQAVEPLRGVLGLVFVGFPLHPAGKPSIRRADHFAPIRIPMLFLQGRRDALADLGLLSEVLSRLGDRATLETFDDADHAFHVRKSSGSSDAMVLSAIAGRAADWMRRVVRGQTP
jgi:predicted alpha/beta-hydrolase family hydrolase